MKNGIKRLVGALLALGTGAALIAAVRRRASPAGDAARTNTGTMQHTKDYIDDTGRKVERFHSDDLPPAQGRDEERDVLGAAHTLTPDAAQQIRAHQRLVRGGKVTSAEREGMFGDARPGGDVGVSGSMSDDIGREDQNPVGPRK